MADHWRQQQALPQAKSSLRAWLCACAMALLLMQSLGLVHGVLHATANTLQATTSEAMPAHADDSGVLGGLWRDHGSRADCQLFDQACPDALHSATFVWLPQPVVQLWCVFAPPARLLLADFFFRARAPPVPM